MQHSSQLVTFITLVNVIGPILYLDACYIRTKATKCVREM